MNIEEVFSSLLIVTLITGLFVVAIAMNATQEVFVDTFSEHNVKRTLIYDVVSAPCINDVVFARPELKKFIFDRSRLDKEKRGMPTISCIDLGTAKYKVYVRDLSIENLMWVYTNYVPLEYEYGTYKTPEVDMVVQINDYTTPPPSEDALIDFDRFKNALVSASFILSNNTDKLPNEIFCEGNPGERVFIIANDTLSAYGTVMSSYHYPDNDCVSGNCIKGPGQSYATCQPIENTYDLPNGPCETDYQCMTFKCVSGNCLDESVAANRVKKLIVGQPCMGNEFMTPVQSCITGYCKYRVTCACKLDSDCPPSKSCIPEKGICIW